MVFIEERGRGEPVVLLHGAPTTTGHLRPLAERLAARWRTLLVHLPGYGRSASLEPYDLPRSYELVEEALSARGVREAHFFGHSGGAYRAFAHATRGAIRASSVIALGAIAHLPEATKAGFAAFAAMLRRGTGLRAIFPGAMLGPRAQAEAACVAEVTSWATASAPAHLASELDALASAPDLRPAIATLDVPILLRVGALDTASAPERTDEIADVAKRPFVHIVPHAGHALLVEDFEATARAIEAHLTATAL